MTRTPTGGHLPLNVVSSHLNITDLLSWKLGWARLVVTFAKGPDPPTHGSVVHRTVSRSCSRGELTTRIFRLTFTKMFRVQTSVVPREKEAVVIIPRLFASSLEVGLCWVVVEHDRG